MATTKPKAGAKKPAKKSPTRAAASSGSRTGGSKPKPKSTGMGLNKKSGGARRNDGETQSAR
jgi:hypothetical protein